MLKICIRCNTESKERKRIGAYHPISNFHVNARSKDGVHSECKDCRIRVTRERRNREVKKPPITMAYSILNKATRAIHEQTHESGKMARMHSKALSIL